MKKADQTIPVEVNCPDCHQVRIVLTQKRHIKSAQGRLCRSCCQKRKQNPYIIQEILKQQIRECRFCGKPFTPKSGNHRCCSGECSRLYFRSNYQFNGKLKEAIGFTNRQCYICRRANVIKHAIHHAWGSDNPNSPLIFLCSGCHNLLTRFWGRKFSSSPSALESFITLALARKMGKIPPKVTVKFSYNKIPINQGKLL